MRRSALISALSLRAGEKKLGVVEELPAASNKTRDLARWLEGLHLEGKKTLCVVKEVGANLKKASQNLRDILDVRAAADINAYHVLQRGELLIEQEALPLIEERLLTRKKHHQKNRDQVKKQGEEA